MESQLEDFRQEILKYQSKLKDMEEHLMVFLGDTSKITSFPEAEYWEKILEEALRRLYVRKAQYSPLETTNVTSFIPEMTNVGGLNWIPPRQVEIINSLESCGPLVQRDHHQHNLLENLTPLLPLPLLFQQQNMNVENPMIRSTFGLEDNGGVHNLELAQGFDVNSSPWNQLYTRGNVQYPVAQGQEPGLLEQFLYGITPSTI